MHHRTAKRLELRFARSCYDHLAGQLGVRVTEELMRSGKAVGTGLGLVVPHSRRARDRCCVDWTERQPHIAGALGAAMLRFYLEEHWLMRVGTSRQLIVTTRGKAMFKQAFGIEDGFFAA